MLALCHTVSGARQPAPGTGPGCVDPGQSGACLGARVHHLPRPRPVPLPIGGLRPRRRPARLRLHRTGVGARAFRRSAGRAHAPLHRLTRFQATVLAAPHTVSIARLWNCAGHPIQSRMATTDDEAWAAFALGAPRSAAQCASAVHCVSSERRKKGHPPLRSDRAHATGISPGFARLLWWIVIKLDDRHTDHRPKMILPIIQ